MDAAFGWLGEIFSAILEFVPRREIIRATHKGVSFKRGKKVIPLGPGITWYWPFWTEISTYPSVEQSLNLPDQNLTTKDLETVTVSGVVFYSISDIVKALSAQWDLEDTMSDRSMGVIADIVCDITFQEINENRKQLNSKMTSLIRRTLKPYGIHVIDARLTDFAKGKVIAVVGGGNAIVDSEDE